MRRRRRARISLPGVPCVSSGVRSADAAPLVRRSARAGTLGPGEKGLRAARGAHPRRGGPHAPTAERPARCGRHGDARRVGGRGRASRNVLFLLSREGRWSTRPSPAPPTRTSPPLPPGSCPPARPRTYVCYGFDANVAEQTAHRRDGSARRQPGYRSPHFAPRVRHPRQPDAGRVSARWLDELAHRLRLGARGIERRAAARGRLRRGRDDALRGAGALRRTSRARAASPTRAASTSARRTSSGPTTPT